MKTILSALAALSAQAGASAPASALPLRVSTPSWRRLVRQVLCKPVTPGLQPIDPLAMPPPQSLLFSSAGVEPVHRAV